MLLLLCPVRIIVPDGAGSSLGPSQKRGSPVITHLSLVLASVCLSHPFSASFLLILLSSQAESPRQTNGDVRDSDFFPYAFGALSRSSSSIAGLQMTGGAAVHTNKPGSQQSCRPSVVIECWSVFSHKAPKSWIDIFRNACFLSCRGPAFVPLKQGSSWLWGVINN